MKSNQPKYQITLQGMPEDSRPVVIRLRIALKLLKRAFSLKCVAIHEVRPDDSTDPHESIDVSP